MQTNSASQKQVTNSSSLGFWIVFLSLIVLHVIAVNVVSIRPFPDLPAHLAAASVVTEYESPETPYQDVFELHTGWRPNALHLKIVSSGVLGSPILASHIIFSVYVIVFPLLVWGIIRASGGNSWGALLAFPFLYGFCVTYGFVEFMVAIPFVLAVILALVCWTRRPSWFSWCALTVLLACVFLSHVFAFVFIVMLVVLAVTIRCFKQPGLWIIGLASIVPGAIVLAIWYVNRDVQPTTTGWLIHHYKVLYWQLLGVRILDWFTLDNKALISPTIGIYVGLFFKLVVICVAIWRFVVWRRCRTKMPRKYWLSRLAKSNGLVPLCVVVTAWFVLLFGPYSLPPGGMFVYQRFIALAFIGLVLLLSLGYWSLQDRRILIIVGCIVAYLYAALWIEHFASFHSEQEDLLAVLPEAGDSQIVGFYVEDARYRGDMEAMEHMGGHFTTLQGGVGVIAMYDWPLWTVQRNVGEDVLPNSYKIKNLDAYLHYPDIHQIIYRGDTDPSSEFLSKYELAEQHGQWQLYQAIGPKGPRVPPPDGE